MGHVSITWDWGDGTTTTEGAVAQHTLPDYTARTITATDAGGLTGTLDLAALPLWDVANWDTDNWGD
jgi:hypothetical protein